MRASVNLCVWMWGMVAVMVAIAHQVYVCKGVADENLFELIAGRHPGRQRTGL
jgi:hypothetical protein